MQISLKAARVNIELKQEDVAKLIHKSKATIANWENGKTPIPINEFRRLCHIYKVEENNIFLPNSLP